MSTITLARHIAAFALLFVVPLHASGQESNTGPSRAALGVEIGVTTALPECVKETRYGGWVDYAPMPSNTPCWQAFSARTSPSSQMPANETMMKVVFDSTDVPNGVGTQAFATTIDGRLESLMIETDPDIQASILQMLVSKWGEPSKKDVVRKENAYGAGVDSVEASWEFPDLRIRFSGAVKMSEGMLVIESTKALQARMSQEPQRATSF